MPKTPPPMLWRPKKILSRLRWHRSPVVRPPGTIKVPIDMLQCYPRSVDATQPRCHPLLFFSGPRTLHRPCGELIDVHLRLAEIAPAALVAAAAVTVIGTETETVIARETAVTATATGIMTGMIAIVGTGIEIAEIGTVIFETRRRTTIVAAGGRSGTRVVVLISIHGQRADREAHEA
jgi:hypothetical protein